QCPEFYFSSSGTTGQQRSQHYVSDLNAYEESFINGFQHFYGDPRQYCFLALLPSYLENKESSLIHMVRGLMKASGNEDSDFYLNNFADLSNKINSLEEAGKKYFLLGVSYALLDFAEQYSTPVHHGIIMETGGMKGRRKEMTREELHTTLCEKFQVSQIHSEYGMTELLSQAYAKSGGRFYCPPWMRVFIRDVNDPFSSAGFNRNGGINVIDLANTDSCAFIETQDLGMLFEDGSFTINGRFDQSDLRGCNLLIVE
ncbi:MAG: acyl transferase, partial [Bacteroidota bacterium]